MFVTITMSVTITMFVNAEIEEMKVSFTIDELFFRLTESLLVIIGREWAQHVALSLLH